MNTAAARTSTPPPVVFRDAFGERRRIVAPSGSDTLDVLCLRGELTAVPSFEFALRERVSRLSGFRHPYFAQVRTVERLSDTARTLALISNAQAGVRISDLLATATKHDVVLDSDAALCLIRQFVTAMATFHEQAPDAAHGALGPERVVVTPNARLVIVEHVMGSAIEQLQYSEDRYWRELRVPCPRAVGLPIIDHRADVLQMGVLALALLLRRCLNGDDFPSRISDAVVSARAVSPDGQVEALPAGLRLWLTSALQLDPRTAYASAIDAREELEKVFERNDDIGAPSALEAFLSRYHERVDLAAEAATVQTQAAIKPPAGSEPSVPAPPAVHVQPVASEPPAREPVAEYISPSLEREHPMSPSLEREHAMSPSLEREHSMSPSLGREHSMSPSLGREHTMSPSLEREHGISPSLERERGLSSSFERERGISPSLEREHGISPSFETIAPAQVASEPIWPEPRHGAAQEPLRHEPVEREPIAVTPPPRELPAESPSLAAKLNRSVEPAPRPLPSHTLLSPHTSTASRTGSLYERDEEKEPTDMPARRKGGGGRRVAVGAIVFLLLAGGGTMAARKYFAPVPISTGTVVVTTNPPGAEVVLDGKTQGLSPTKLTVVAGAHILELRGAGEPRTMSLDVAAGAQLSQYFEMAKGALAAGSLQVRTDPPGAKVSVDGVARGASPVTVADLLPGEHAVVLEGESGTTKQTVTIEAGATASLVANLAASQGAVASSGGWISVSTPKTVQLLENGRLLGSSDSERLMVPAGTHQLEIVNDALGYRSSRTVQVTAGKVSPIKVEFPTGTIALNAVPWADVWIDGEKVGETPIGNLSVTLGSHEVIFRHPDLGEQRHLVTVTLSAPARLSVDMRKKP